MPKSKHRNKKQNKPKPIKWKSDKELFKVPAIPRMTVDFPRPDSNAKMEFTRIYTFPPNVPESKIPRSLLGGQSVYRVTYYLAIPGVDIFYDKVDIGKLFKSGNSLLQMPPEDTFIITATNEEATENVQIHCFHNQNGLLSHIQLRVNCNSFEVAERFAHERVSTILSYWSFIYDIGIEIGRYEILEETTGSIKYSVGLVGSVKPFNNDKPFTLFPEYRRIFAAYREAMNSSNLFYQMLCFFKVTEGLISLRQKEIKKIRPLRKGEQGFEKDEKFPDDITSLPVKDEITKLAFTNYLGKNFQEVRDSLKDEFRHAIAHLVKFDSVIDADRFDDVSKCARAVHVIKFMARKMLENNLNKLSSKDK